jgi:anti-anti-sigma factor
MPQTRWITVARPVNGHFAAAIEQEGPRAVLRCRGELDFASCPTVETMLDSFLASTSAHELHLDWSHVSFADSSSIRLLIRALRRSTDVDVRPTWDLGEPVRKLLDILGIDQRRLMSIAKSAHDLGR